MNPYAVLGIPASSSLTDAKSAFRRLAGKHHPDRGGSEEKFKEVKAAWELIESGKYVAQPPPPPVPPAQPTKSSFGASSFTQGLNPKQTVYSKPSRIYLPETVRINGKHDTYSLDVSCTAEQAVKGCVIPFIHDGVVHDYMVRPGATPRSHSASMNLDNTIGKFPPTKVNLIINFFVNS